MKKTKTLLLIGGILMLSSCEKRYQIKEYPSAGRDETVVDDYFGTKVADPYRWLENDTSAETSAWVEAQRQLTNEYLSHIPYRQTIKDRMTQLADYERYGVPSKRFGKYFYSKNDGLQNQSVMYVQNADGGEPEVLLDPNKLSDDGTVSLGSTSLSNDGKYLAYTINRSGSDWVEIYVMNVETRELLDDHIEWAKFTGASWYKDGFFYAAYDKPVEGKEFSNVNENHKIYYHKLGDSQENDELFYENPDQPRYFHSVGLTDDERYMFLYESGQGAGHTLWIRDMQNSESQFVMLADNMDFQYSPVDVIDGKLYVQTNHSAPKGKVCVVCLDDLTKAGIENWEVLIPESANVMVSAQMADGKMIVTYDQDASNHSYVCDLQGNVQHEIDFPTFGAVGIVSRGDEQEVFYAFTSFTFPTTIYKYDVESNVSEVFRAPAVDFNPEDYVTEQVFFNSKDGTRIPMFLTYRKDIKMDGKNPTYMYGYGGFNITLNPGFSVMRVPFLEMGGIYAQVNLRGGNEYGEEWHLAGTKLQKQNVFDDFISAGEYLVEKNYTSPDYLAIVGGSNGGLLVGACANQRPDLFKVAVPEVGVMDMLRYHLFTIGWNWASDYGTSADSKEMFDALYAYSPLHNIKSGDNVHYPAIMVTTADHDDRVVPAHSFKYAATLQAAQTGDEPKIIRIDSKAGHGGGKPMAKVIEEQADIYAFILYNMGK